MKANTSSVMPIPAPVRLVLTTLHHAGYEAYVVGGCVRDFLMGRVPGDYDVTSAALPGECMDVFHGWRIIETGLQHGTVTVVAKGETGHENVEITTFRIDGTYLDNRHPENVTFTRSLAEDLARRDFTVNAMAYSEDSGVIDLYDGMGDLQRKTIRCVGDAARRFREDGLRILRALRFSAVLDFSPAVDDGNPVQADDALYNKCSKQEEKLSTAQAIHALRELLRGISRERIHVELTKLLCGIGAGRILRAYPDVVETILPMLSEDRVIFAADALERLWAHRADFGSVADTVGKEPGLRYALLFDGCTEAEMRAGVHSLKMSRAQEGLIRTLWQEKIPPIFISEPVSETIAEERYHMRKLAGQYGYDFCRLTVLLHFAAGRVTFDEAQEKLSRIACLEKKNPCISLANLALNGQDMQALGIRGARIGQVLKLLLELVLRDEAVNDRDCLLEKVKEIQNGQ